jgi:hypothetical protein
MKCLFILLFFVSQATSAAPTKPRLRYLEDDRLLVEELNIDMLHSRIECRLTSYNMDCELFRTGTSIGYQDEYMIFLKFFKDMYQDYNTRKVNLIAASTLFESHYDYAQMIERIFNTKKTDIYPDLVCRDRGAYSECWLKPLVKTSAKDLERFNHFVFREIKDYNKALGQKVYFKRSIDD